MKKILKSDKSPSQIGNPEISNWTRISGEVSIKTARKAGLFNSRFRDFGSEMGWCRAFGMLALLLCGSTPGIWAGQQESDSSKAKVPLVSVVGCATHMGEGTWMLTSATDGVESKVLFMSAKEIEEAKKKALGKNQYKLLGTLEFLTKEEILKDPLRAKFTRPDVANATGQLQEGRKLLVKGLLITAPNEKRLNLVAVQQLADTCK